MLVKINGMFIHSATYLPQYTLNVLTFDLQILKPALPSAMD